MTVGRHVHLVPKDPFANAAWRKNVLAALAEDKDGSFTEDVWQCCAEDVLFYVNAFCFLHEPRPLVSCMAVLQFITYEYQDEAFEQIFWSIEHGENLCIIKSRDMGASWLILTSFEHFWHFREGQTFLLVSRNEDYVDNPGDMKGLFQKIDFIHKHLPLELMPSVTRVKNHIGNDDLMSAINGESTTGEVAAGNRLTGIGIDEYAKFKTVDGFKALGATQFAADCRIFNSTFDGTSDAFHKVSKNEKIKKLFLPWWKHPRKAFGLYLDENGKRRSPWYDKECDLADDPRIIARELDMNPEGAQSQFFDSSLIDRLQKSAAVEPYMRGELVFSRETGHPIEFEQREEGRFLLWVPLSGDSPPSGDYVIGADIASGTGASNSVLSVVDRTTRAKVMEYAAPDILPEVFASFCAAVCRWLGDNVYVVPEDGGPGFPFIKTLSEMWGENIYMRTSEQKIDEPMQMTMGWHSNQYTQYQLLVQYRRALSDGMFINPSWHALEECRSYVYGPGQTILHAVAMSGDDPSGARANHGDRCKADALANLGLGERPIRPEQADEDDGDGDIENMNPHSHEYRFRKWRSERQEAEIWA